MTPMREVLAVLSIWVQCGMGLMVVVVGVKLIIEYWQHLDAQRQQRARPETMYKANTLWRPK